MRVRGVGSLVGLIAIGLLALPASAAQPDTDAPSTPEAPVSEGPVPETPTPEAPAADQAWPTAQELFARHAELVGGLEAFESFDSRLLKGSIRGNNNSFMTAYYEKPNKLALIMKEVGGPEYVRVFDGRFAWATVDGGEPHLIRGAPLIEFVESSDFFGEVNFKERYRAMQTLGVEERHGRQVYRVGLESRYGRRGLAFFDQETGLLSSMLTPQIIGDQLYDMETTLEDYNSFEGVTLPKVMTQRVLNTEFVSEIRVRSIEWNADRSELFERTEAVQAAIDAAEAEAEAEAAKKAREEAESTQDGEASSDADEG